MPVRLLFLVLSPLVVMPPKSATRCQTYSYFSSRPTTGNELYCLVTRAKGWGVNNLPRVVTQLRSDRESHPTTSWTHVRHPTVQLSRYYRRSRVENHNTSLYSTFYGGWKRDTARICCCAVAAGRRTCSSRYYLPARPTAAKPPHDAAAVNSWDRQTNRQTDTVPLRRPCRVLCEQCQMQIWL